jgi:hypothetical protein
MSMRNDFISNNGSYILQQDFGETQSNRSGQAKDAQRKPNKKARSHHLATISNKEGLIQFSIFLDIHHHSSFLAGDVENGTDFAG